MDLTIGFDATAAARQAAGIGRYTRELLIGLNARDDSFSYRLFWCAAGRTNGRLPALDRRFRVRALPISDRLLNVVWHRWHLPVPAQIATGAFDLFHSPDFTLPPVLGKPTVLTVHDLAFLRTPDCAYPTLRAYLERVVPLSVRRASHVIAVSESTRNDLIDLLGVDPNRVTTVLEGVSPDFRPSDDRAADTRKVAALGVDDEYILSVGTLEPRKNYVRLLEAYALLRQRGVRHRLLIAGDLGWLYEPIFQRLEELRLGEHVTVLRPDDSALIALYRSADVFVFPSLYEGFGIPPLEALACGAPVACSDAASLPEVAGDAAILFDPLDVPQIADSVWRILSDSRLQSDLRHRGPRQAASFTWDRAAEQTVQVYRQVAAVG